LPRWASSRLAHIAHVQVVLRVGVKLAICRCAITANDDTARTAPEGGTDGALGITITELKTARYCTD
jgi:hypothetical protein